MEKLYLVCVFFFAVSIISCHKDSLPTTPTDRNDVDLWNSVLIDQNGGAQIIAALRSDGIPRLYSGIYEYEYIDNKWLKANISGSQLLAIGKCKNDGILRMYGISSTSICEFNYAGNQWTRQDIVSPNYAYILTIGDPRKDGYESIYINRGGVYEIRYKNETWEGTLLDTTKEIIKMCCGDGRGDGKDGIYIMDRSTTIIEIRYENGSWLHSKIGQLASVPPDAVPAYTALSITNSHNGRPNVVASFGELIEFHFDTDHWTSVKIGVEPGVNQISDGIGRNDGIDRIYCAVNFDVMAEYTLTGTSWTKTSQRKTGKNTAITAVVVGPGRGDGINRIYVSAFLGGLYEFTFKH